jgi:uncharacterized membrane protein YjdF
MNHDRDEHLDREFREQQRVDRYLAKRAKAARGKYQKAVTRLWIGNAGGAVLTVNAAQHLSPRPIYFFLSGLLILGLAAAYELIVEWLELANNQDARNLLGLRGGFARSPLRASGFAPATILTILSAVCFVAGCGLGLWEIADISN